MNNLVEQIKACGNEIKWVLCEREGRLTDEQIKALDDLIALCMYANKVGRTFRDFDEWKVEWVCKKSKEESR